MSPLLTGRRHSGKYDSDEVGKECNLKIVALHKANVIYVL